MLYGLTNFMGATVGGAAGAVSRITGTIGKQLRFLTCVVFVITWDKKIQMAFVLCLRMFGKYDKFF